MPRRPRGRCAAVLDVDVPDEARIGADRGRRVGAAVAEVAGVEAQPHQRRIDPAHQPLDVRRRLDVRAGMRVEHRLEALARHSSAARWRFDKRVPASVASWASGCRSVRPVSVSRTSSSIASHRTANGAEPPGCPRGRPSIRLSHSRSSSTRSLRLKCWGRNEPTSASPRASAGHGSPGPSPRNPGGPSSVPT